MQFIMDLLSEPIVEHIIGIDVYLVHDLHLQTELAKTILEQALYQYWLF